MNLDVICIWAEWSQNTELHKNVVQYGGPSSQKYEDLRGASWIDRGGSQKSGRLCRFQIRYYLTDVDQDVDQRSFKASGPLKDKLGLWQAS